MLKRKITAILAADIAGYSRLVAEDEDETLTRLASYREVFEDFISRSGGRVFNTAGDAIMAEFQSAVDAVRCALDVQQSLRARNMAYPPGRQMNFRMGVAIGDVVDRDGDLLGDCVNIAARLESLAPEGGVCISRSVYEAVSNKVSVRFSDRGLQRLKNMPDPVHAYIVSIEEDGKPSAWTPGRANLAVARWTAGLAAATLIAVGAMVALRLQQPKPGAPTTESLATINQPAKAPAPSDAIASSAGQGSASQTIAGDADKPANPKTPAPQDAAMERRRRECFDAPFESAVTPCRAILDWNGLPVSDRAQAELRLGRGLREKGDAAGAIEALSRAINHAATADAYNYRGISRYDLQQWNDAIADYTEALRIDADHGEALNNRAWTYFRTNRPNDGLADADKAVRILADKAFVWDTRAHILEALGNRKAAIRDYRKALSIDPQLESSREALERLSGKP